MNPAELHCMECGALLAPDYPALLCATCVWGAGTATGGPATGPGPQAMPVPGHEVLEEIARGGMGVVYRAREKETRRTVALKMLRPRLADEPGMRERFRLEARSVAALDHPAILPVYRVDEAGDLPFFTMKLAAGGTLADRREALGGQWREIAALFASLAAAVHYAHLHGVLHRDLKPQNVLFDDADKAYVADFGLVKLIDSISGLTGTHDFLGTPHYSAPEVAASHAGACTVVSDVWSLGAMLYEVLAGRLAFEAPGIPALLRRIVEEPPPPLPPTIPRDLRVICLKCLAKSTASRYQSAAALEADLRRWLEGRPIHARATGWVERRWIQAKRNPAMAGLSLALFAALLTATGAIIRESHASREAQWISEKAAAASRIQEAAALLAEARAKRTAGSFLSRESAMAAVRRSWLLDPRPEVRDELLSLLAMPGVERLPDAVPHGTFRGWGVRPDGDLSRYVILTKEGCSIRRFSDGVEECLIPDFPLQTATRGYPPGPLSPDGRLLPVRRGQATVVWDLARREVILELPGLNGIRSFSSGGDQFLATGLLASGLKPHLCNLRKTPPDVRIFEALPPGWVCRTLSPDGRFFVAGGVREPGLRLYRTEDFSLAMEYNHPEVTSQWEATWSQDSRYFLISTHLGKVTCWSPLLPDPVWILEAHAGGVSTPALFNNNTGMATLGNDGTLKLWNLITLHPADAIPMSGLALEGSRDGTLILADDSLRRERPRFVCRPSITAQAIKIPPAVIPNPYAPGQPWIQRSGADGGFILTTGHGLHRMDPEGTGIHPAADVPQNDALARDPVRSGFFRITDRSLTYHDADGKERGALPDVPRDSRLAFNPTLRILVVGSPGGFAAWRIPLDGAAPAELALGSLGLDAAAAVTSLTWSANGRWLAWSGTKPSLADPAIRTAGTWLADTSTGQEIPMPLPPENAAGLAFADQDNVLLAATATHVHGVAVAPGNLLWSQVHERQSATPPCLVACPGGRVAAVTLEQETIALLDAREGRILCRLTHPITCTVRAMDFDASGRRLAVVAGHFAQTWDLEAIRTTLDSHGMPGWVP
ncbi:MAG: hypothetical protein JWL81_1792 [Verrucomicrobiales bacterium]|nr:hypothetical protein [Verrucomicrobiales bacterium]